MATSEVQNGVLTLKEIRANPRIKAYIEGANELLNAIGYTEHGFRHAGIVAGISKNIIATLGYEPRQAELAAIAGYMHDIGNVISRTNHPQTGATMAFRLLEEMGMETKEIALIIGAIGNHEEPGGEPVHWMSAAVILADKSDVHSSRVQNPDPHSFDIHDRVNFAVQRSRVDIIPEEKKIILDLQTDGKAASMMEYFEIFLERMVMCNKAAQTLGCRFHLHVNGTQIG
jgi:metal-dependent HD superfamily phosphatase/phosphodiesterase